GQSPKREQPFDEVAEDYRAYGEGNRHRHVPEMRRGLDRLSANAALSFAFTPHPLRVRRGAPEAVYLPLAATMAAADAAQLWAEAYAGEPFIEVLGEELPGLQHVVGRNVVALGFAEIVDVAVPTLLLVAALDNLLKGAAGQALQNANLMLGLEETDGLPC